MNKTHNKESEPALNLDVLLEPVEVETKPCKVGRILADLDDKYRAALQHLLDLRVTDGGLSDDAIADRLTRAGIPAGSKTVYKHRRNQCTCPQIETANK